MSARGKRRKGKPPPSGATGRSSGPIRPEQAAAVENGDDNQDGNATAASFERELLWCIRKLEAGLNALEGNPDPNLKQVADSLRALKTLQNPKAPMVKKRLVMRNTFGDYRKKMAEEERKHAQSMKKMKLEPVSQPSNSTSSYLKKASCKSKNKPTDSTGSEETEQGMSSMMSEIQIGTGNSGFKFNFGETEPQIDPKTITDPQDGGGDKGGIDASKSDLSTCSEGTQEPTGSSGLKIGDGTSRSVQDDSDQKLDLTSSVAVNYFNIKPGNESFKFDFHLGASGQ